MSVLIKGMKMPKTCKECDIETTDCWCGVVGECTDSVRKIGSSRYNGRFETCPLIEIPEPHGDLVDVSEVKKCLHDLPDSEDKWGAIALLEWAMEKRTVIEAEGVEEIQGCNDDGCPIFFGESSDGSGEGAEE